MRPPVLLTILVAVSVVFAIFLFANRSRAALHGDIRSSFVPDPHNKVLLTVKGWDKSELDKILADFSRQYDLPGSTFKLEAVGSQKFNISFPGDIEPRLLFFLVNYLHYPNGMNLKTHAIAAVAHVTLTPTFGVPDTTMVGSKARIYVPSNDNDFDVVYVQPDLGPAYRVSFTNLVWKRVDDARMPSAINGL